MNSNRHNLFLTFSFYITPSDVSYLPDANAGLDWFSMFQLRLLLCKNLFDGVCILENMSLS